MVKASGANRSDQGGNGEGSPMTIPSIAGTKPAAQDEKIARAAGIFWNILYADARRDFVERDALKAEFAAIAQAVGPGFWNWFANDEAARVAKALKLPPQRLHLAEAAIAHDLTKHFGREILLAIVVPEGRA
jgi:hypothetical protein